MKIWKCKRCGRRSFTGRFCLNCDRSVWANAWRTRFIQLFIPSALVCLSGDLIILFFHNSLLGFLLTFGGMMGMVGVFIYSITLGTDKNFELVEED